MSAQREPLFTCNRLALLSGMDRRTVEKRLLTVTPAKEDRRGRHYRLADALPLLTQAPDNAEAEKRILDSRNREAAARAESAEMQSMKLRGECREVARQMFAEGFAQLKSRIESASYLNQKQRAALYKDLHAISLGEDEG